MNRLLKAMIVLKFECQDNFAEVVNQSSSFISRVVRGRRKISDEKKKKWAKALGCSPSDLPPITSTKSMIGHALGAAGGIESVACVLMLKGGFVHPSINCEDVHPEIEPYAASIPHAALETPDLQVVVKAGFGRSPALDQVGVPRAFSA